MSDFADTSASLIHLLMKPECYDHSVTQLKLIETHISWVILTGPYAYKIKKPVDFGFLNFSSLDQRLFYCQEEIRLNKRLAAGIYLEVVSITGTSEKPCLGGAGKAIEYAVKMVQFSPDEELERLYLRSELGSPHLDEFSRIIADFHQQIEVATSQDSFGEVEMLYQPVIENYFQIRNHLEDSDLLTIMSNIEQWTGESKLHLKSVFIKRKHDGFIRECHGDIHLRNMCWINNKPVLFDCIEFNPALRWIDVISDIAFLLMDLQKHKCFSLSQRVLNNYLERTGDYAGVSVLNFYLVYRAMVRCKVAIIRAGQNDISIREKEQAQLNFSDYLHLADKFIQTGRQQLIITHGFSASGKSFLTQLLLEKIKAVRIRSDVERKRLFGLQVEDRVEAEIYSDEASQQTYDKLLELAEQILDGGYSVIVDAANLKYEQRRCFQTLAEKRKIDYFILDLTVPESILRERIVSREKGVSDADLSVLEHQLINTQYFMPEELSRVISVNTDASLDIDCVIEKMSID